MLWQYNLKLDKNFNPTFEETRPLLTSMTAKICIKNVDEIISWSFPVIGVFNWRLTNIEVGFILQQFFK